MKMVYHTTHEFQAQFHCGWQQGAGLLWESKKRSGTLVWHYIFWKYQSYSQEILPTWWPKHELSIFPQWHHLRFSVLCQVCDTSIMLIRELQDLGGSIGGTHNVLFKNKASKATFNVELLSTVLGGAYIQWGRGFLSCPREKRGAVFSHEDSI